MNASAHPPHPMFASSCGGCTELLSVFGRWRITTSCALFHGALKGKLCQIDMVNVVRNDETHRAKPILRVQ